MERWRAHPAVVGDRAAHPGVRRIVSLSRTGSLACPGSGESFSFNDGELYAGLRAELLDRANFGPSGRVPVTLELRPSIDLRRRRRSKARPAWRRCWTVPSGRSARPT
jgi:hypothetical protein